MPEILRAPPLIGRQCELVRLEACLCAVLHGRPRLALLPGEAGIGKTRLVREIAGIAGAAGVRVCVGRCYEDLRFPYLSFAEAPTALLEGESAGDLPELARDAVI